MDPLPGLNKPPSPSAAPDSSFPPTETLPLLSRQLALCKPQCLPEVPTHIFYEPVRTLKEAGLKVAWVTQEERHPGWKTVAREIGAVGGAPTLGSRYWDVEELTVQISPNSFSAEAAGLPSRDWV